MAEIDTFQSSMTQEQQSEYLKSINQSMTRLVDISEQSSHSSSQFFQSNAVQSTVASFRDLPQISYDKFTDDLVSVRGSLQSASNRFSDTGSTVVGTAQELSSHLPGIHPLAPIGANGFFGASSAYSTNYRSTFWNDLWGGYLGERAPQTMYQSDFAQTAVENMHLRMGMLNPVRAAANLLGVDTSIDEAAATDIVSMSQRYQRFGSSNSISGIGTTRGQAINLIEHERGILLDKLGYNQDEFNATRQIFAAGGQFVGTRNEIERSNMTFQGMSQVETLAKALAVPMQDAARAMMEIRQQVGITSTSGQAAFLMQSQALGMASGLNFQEVMSGVSAGAGIARQLGYNVSSGAVIGRDTLASVNSSYLNGAIDESLVQSAGGIQNLSQNLASSAISFASGPGSMYYMASMRGGQFNQNDFNSASGGFAQLGSMAASNVSTIQSYANFMANKDSIQAQGGSFNVMAMQRAHMSNIFKNATGRDYDSSSTEDTNMMKMLAGSSGMFNDPTTAKAFVEMNFTENGQDSMYATQRDAYKAEQNLKFKSSLDERFQSTSNDALARKISNVWNKPVQGIRASLNKVYAGFGSNSDAQEQLQWATGVMSPKLSSADISDFSNSGGFSRDLSSGPQLGGDLVNNAYNNSTWYGRAFTGAYEGGALGAKIGGPISLAAGLTGVGLVGGIALEAGMTGLGAIIGAGYGILSSPADRTTEHVIGKDYDKTVSAWNRAGGFSDAEKNAMGDPDFQKRALTSLMANGLSGTFKVTEKNQDQINAAVKATAEELGTSEALVAQIAQRSGGIQGVMMYGAELAWAQTGAVNMQSMSSELDSKLQNVLNSDVSFKDLMMDAGFSTKLGSLLGSTGGSVERQQLGAKFFAKYGDSISGETRSTLENFVKSGSMSDRSSLSKSLLQYGRNLQSNGVQDSIKTLFGSRAKMDEYASVSDDFNEIANAKSASDQVHLVENKLSDENFRNSIKEDSQLKKLLNLDGPIDRSMLKDSESFKKRFSMNPVDDLKVIQNLFDQGGEQALRDRMVGNVISQTAKSDTSNQKQNEASLLDRAANTLKEVTTIVSQMKGK